MGLMMEGANNGKITFFSTRSDGLGQRLWSIINAIILCEKYNGIFLFSWPMDQVHALQNHAISSPYQIFKAEYIERHSGEVPNNSISISDPNFTQSIASLRNFAFQSEPIFLKSRIPEIQVSYKDYRLAVSRIGFSERVVGAIEAAQKFDIGINTVAVQVRAGDIIYGNYRFDDRFHSKVVPFPFFEHELSEAIKIEREILVFGQDDQLCDYLAQKYAGKRPFYSEEADLQAIFEVFLLSRCPTILGGSSGFAQIASCIGGGSIVNPQRGKAPKQIKEIYDNFFFDDSDLVSNLQKAFIQFNKFKSCQSVLPLKQQSALVESCCQLDPSNDFYKVICASLYYKDGLFAKAESILSRCSGKNANGALWRVLISNPSRKNTVEKYLSAFHGAASMGNFMANLCLGVNSYHRGHLEDAERHLNRCWTADPNSRNANFHRLASVLSVTDKST